VLERLRHADTSRRAETRTDPLADLEESVVSDDTRHVTPSAPRTLSDKPFPPDIGSPQVRITRGTPIEKMGDISLASPLEARIVEKLEEIIDRINATNSLPLHLPPLSRSDKIGGSER